jgi:two-component system sensor kinase FixL
MNWITFIWPMATGAFLTMALVHLWTGLRKPGGRVNVLFAISAIFAAIYSWYELGMTQANSPAEFLARMRWLDLAAGGVAVSLVAFVWDYFGAGRKWFGRIAIGVMLGSLIPDLFPVPKLVFLEITGIRKVSTFGGATYTLGEGIASPWNLIFYGGVFLLLAFVADASLRLWRRGDRRKALVVGGTVVLFYLVGGVQAFLTDLGVLHTPYLVSFCWMGILVVMAWELSNDQLRAEQLTHELRENQQRMSLAARAADLGLWEWDIRRDEIWASEAGLERAGIDRSERMSLDRYIALLHPDDRDSTLRAVRRALEDGREFQAEFRMINPQGEMIWLAASGQVERGEDGKPLHMRGVSVNITERKATEAELQTQRAELAHAQRVLSLGQLSSALAHEINQPLGAILRNAEAAELFLRQDPPDVEELRAILVDIRRDDQRASSVIDRMRSLLKRRELQFETLAVDELVGQVTTLLHAEAQAHQVTLRVDVPQEIPRVKGDRVYLQQVMLNLIINSMDAVDGLPLEQRNIVIRASQSEDRMVELAVIDRGAGIFPNVRSNLFEPFVTTKSKGTGIGLSISKSIVELHGGQISAENNPEGGATFRFTLKVAEHGGEA